MSVFSVILTHSLPQQFRTSIDSSDKIAVASKLVKESFLTRSNIEFAKNAMSAVDLIGKFRLVNGWTVTMIYVVDSMQKATQVKTILEEIAARNANQIGRSWVHPALEVPQINEIGTENWPAMFETYVTNHVPVDLTSYNMD